MNFSAQPIPNPSQENTLTKQGKVARDTDKAYVGSQVLSRKRFKNHDEIPKPANEVNALLDVVSTSLNYSVIVKYFEGEISLYNTVLTNDDYSKKFMNFSFSK